MRAGGDQMFAQRDDSRIARRRAGFDHQQRIAGLLPHQRGQRALLGGADLADHVAGNDEVGGVGLGQRVAGFATFVTDIAQAKTLADEIDYAVGPLPLPDADAGDAILLDTLAGTAPCTGPPPGTD